jgi:6-phosphogluconolactonase (cycloisomerase 2 family)
VDGKRVPGLPACHAIALLKLKSRIAIIARLIRQHTEYILLAMHSFVRPLLWLSFFIPMVGFAQTVSKNKVALYAGNGPELKTYSLDIEGASLTEKGSVTLPQNVQEAWPHPTRKYLYVAWSNNVKGPTGRHGLTAFRIDPATGQLQQHGEPVTLTARSVFTTVDIPGKHIIVASNDPSGVTVHRIADDGTLGAEVVQRAGLDVGIYAHQVRVDPSNRMVIVVTRGNAPTSTKPEDPGAIKVFGYQDGHLTNRASIATNGGYDFQPRHLEFHPSKPFAFVTLERQNKVQVYRVTDGPSLSKEPLYTKETLVDPAHMSAQATSAIHAHPTGRFLYLGNRGGATTQFQGKRVTGGENSIAVYSIDQATGEPALIQNADTHGVHPRTFAIDPSGRILVVANMQQVLVRDKNEVKQMASNLSVFRIGKDGKLEFARKYDQDSSGDRNLFWTGMVALP